MIYFIFGSLSRLLLVWQWIMACLVWPRGWRRAWAFSLYPDTCPVTLCYRLGFMRRFWREMRDDLRCLRAEAAAREEITGHWERCFTLMLSSATRLVYNAWGREPVTFTPEKWFKLWFKAAGQTYLERCSCKTNLLLFLVPTQKNYELICERKNALKL